MSLAPITSSTQLTPVEAGTTRGDVPLHGLRLRLLQALWLILVLIDLAILVTNLPAYYHALFTTCTGPLADCQITDAVYARRVLDAKLLHCLGYNALTFLDRERLESFILEVADRKPFVVVPDPTFK